MPDRRPNIVLLVVIAIAVLALAAILVTSAGGDDDDSAGSSAAGVEETQPVDVSGTPLAPFESTSDDGAVGTAAPVVDGKTFTGEPISVGGTGPQVLVFVAHWCPHCQREVPFLVDYFDEHGMPDGVDVRSVSTAVTSQRPNYPPSAWLEREDWTVPTMADSDEGDAATAFGLTAFPYFVAIDKDGDVAARASGELEEAQLEALFDAARA